MKLYRSAGNPTRWYAYATETGWVMFPKEADGWQKRQPAHSVDPIDIREVPVRLALNTGIPVPRRTSAVRVWTSSFMRQHEISNSFRPHR
jgi:hypothetical protein